ncbi:sulfatase [Phycisphaerales bacterium AB-hyl4]|uniref:Sulfatase n=1 Tax=Natronomicrosphaera hydrolytica TaxID=3242702 RepID=A0ABV4U6V8_9BACT
MNVIYMHSHDTGRRIGPYGYAVHTPHLSRLADEGVLFRQAYCAAPTCSPSRAALLTGQWAHCTGMLGLHHRGFRLHDPERHLAHFLGNNGYDTTLVGVNHVATEPEEIGYGRVLPTKGAEAEYVAPAAAAFLNAGPREPFFLDCGFVETHRGRFPAADELDPADRPERQRPPFGMPDTPPTRLDSARFATAARRMDRGVGTVLEALEASGLADNTLVICTTDHGISFPRQKCCCSDAGMEVMLMLRGPGETLRGGRTLDTLTSQIDLFPTLCDLLNLEPPTWLQGRSLKPVLDGRAEQVNDAVFAEVTYHAGYEPQRAVRTDRWKLVRRFGSRRRPLPSNVDDGPSKDLWLKAGYFEREAPGLALYDLWLDPSERENLAEQPAHATVREQLDQRLSQWMRDTDDPLLAGDVPLPAGAIANAPDDLSPKDIFRKQGSA